MYTKEDIQSIKNISLSALLASLNIHPKRSYPARNCHWYLSPLREEKRPSFVVNTQRNLFYDVAAGMGGSIIDFVMQYNNCDYITALKYLSNKIALKPYMPVVNKQTRVITNYNIKKLCPLTNKALLDYLQSRCINLTIAKKHLKEMHYSVGEKKYFAMAMVNNSNGYEIRNKYFKGCLEAKDATFIKGNDSSRVSVFEGFTDFLSILSMYGLMMLKTDVIVLHSVTMVNRLNEQLKCYKKAYTFLDNDDAGIRTTKKIKALLSVKEMNYLYKDSKDVNEFLVASK